VNFDLAVIGSGPAGLKGAINAAKLGKRVVVVERCSAVGGVCVNTGTIPSKALREAILHAVGYRRRWMQSTDGSDVQRVTMSELTARTQTVIRSEITVLRDQLRRNGVHFMTGEASFTDPHRLSVRRPEGQDEVSAQHILIAVGSRPYHPPDIPFTEGRIIDSDQIIQLTELPRSALVVGGGVIGVEYSCMLAAVGVAVTQTDMRARLLEFCDTEIAEALQYHMRSANIRLKFGEEVSRITLLDDEVEAVLRSGKTIRTQIALIAAGRQANTDNLNLSAAGLSADQRGRLRVDEAFRTEVPHISAAGDVIGFPSLAATAMEQGRLATNQMFGEAWEEQSPLFPIGIYTIPEISMVGKTEAELTKEGVPFEVGIARYREIARGKLIGDTVGMLKLIFHAESRRLLGTHILGEGATELVHIGQCAMSAGMPIDYFVSSVFNYPTLAECYRVAALDGINRVRKVRSTPAAPAAARRELAATPAGA